MNQKDVIIVIPIYRPFTANEKCSFQQCIKVLGKYEITFLKPQSLDISRILKEYPALKCTSLDDKWFKSIHTYNELVLNSLFYELFSDYNYILIYQPDAYVFRDELTEWVQKGYDYVGSPWMPGSNKYEGFLGKAFLKVRLKMSKWLRRDISSIHLHYRVGNGGFSLRKTSKMIEVTQKFKEQIQDFLSDKNKLFQEDVFLCIRIKEKASLRIPDYKEALGFGFELNPSLSYKLNGHKLPFGCHDWSREKRWNKFWKYYIRLS